MKKSSIIKITSLFALLFATSAFASEFGEKAANVWIKRNESLIEAGKKVIEYNEQKQKNNSDLGSYLPNVRAACDGLFGEIIANGGTNTPSWAQTAQQKFCGGTRGLESSIVDAGASALLTNRGTANKEYCKDLKGAVSYAKKVKKNEESPELYASAIALAEVAEKLMETDFKVKKWSVLGTSELHLKCK